MPPVSQAQREAMRAAKAGKSTLGIPKSVGKEFSDADPGGKLPQKVKSKKGYDRSSHHKGNPGFPSSSEAGGSPPPATYAAHESREKEVMGAGYQQHEKLSNSPGLTEMQTTTLRNRTPHAFGVKGQTSNGVLRNSGHPKAHRIGKR